MNHNCLQKLGPMGMVESLVGFFGTSAHVIGFLE
jgi:hypothetical protein